MSSLGIPEVFVIVFVVLVLLGTPALAVILILALRRSAGAPASTAAPQAAPTQPRPGALIAGKFRADGSTLFSSGGLRAQRIERGVYHLQFDGFNPAGQYLVNCTAVASLAAEAPVIAEVLGGEARARYAAAGVSAEGVLLRLRQPDLTLADRDFMVEIVAVL